MTDKELIAEVNAIKEQMISVATGGPPMATVKAEYYERWERIDQELRGRGIENPNPHDDIWKWYGKWSSGDLPSYQSRRRYVGDLYSGLLEAIRTGRTSETGVRDVEPTGWARVDRGITKARAQLAAAKNEEDFQGVGLICREVLISLAQAVYDPARHPPTDDKTPSETDAGRMLDAYVAQELKGSDNEAVRRHAKAALSLTLALQHRRTASARDAAMCAEATTSVVNLIAIVDKRDFPSTTVDSKEKPRSVDRALFEQFKQELPSSGAIAFIDKNNFGFSFRWDRLKQLDDFYHRWGDSEHEFMDADLEKRRLQLHGLIGEYLECLSINTFATHTSGVASVPAEWEEQDPKRFREVVNTLHDFAGRIVASHQDLIRAGRHSLEA